MYICARQISSICAVLRIDQIQKCHQEGGGRLRLNQKEFLMVEKGVRRVCKFWPWYQNLKNSVVWS